MARIVLVESVEPQGSVSIGRGTCAECDASITFAGDWRPMADIAAAIEAGEIPDPIVPNWAILGGDACNHTVEDPA